MHHQLPTRVGETAVRLWDLSSRTFLAGAWKHPAPVHALAFNRAGNRLLTASTDKKARLFAVPGTAGQAAPLFAPIPHEPRYPGTPAFIDGDRRLVAIAQYQVGVDQGPELTCRDAETGQPVGPGALRARPVHPPRVVASPQGDWFATAGHFGPEVWKAADLAGPPLYLLEHNGYLEDVVPSPDGRTVLSVSWDQTARLWSIPDGKPLGPPLPHMGVVTQGAFGDDNIHLATVADGLVRVWRRPEGGAASIQPVDWRGIPRPSPDGRLLFPGIWHEEPNNFAPIGANELLIRSALTGLHVPPVISLPGRLVDSCACADNRTMAALSENAEGGWLSLHDVSSGRALAAANRLPGSPRSVAARPSSPHVAVLCAGGELLVFDSRGGQRVLNLNHDGQPALWRTSRVAYTPDGATLVSLLGNGNDSIHVREAGTGRTRYPPIRPSPQGGPCRTFALSADSRLLATGVNGKNAAQVWELAAGRALSQPLPHPGDFYGIFGLCFSPDGRHLLTGCKDGQARLWDWRAGTLACPPLKHEDEVHSVALTPDGHFAVTGARARDNHLRVWELTTAKPVAPKVAFPGSVESIWCSPDGSRVVAYSSLGIVGRIDLGKLLTRPELSTEGYRLLGELASGQRIEQGDESGLTQQEWLDRLGRFNRLHPAFGRPAAEEAIPPGKQAEPVK